MKPLRRIYNLIAIIFFSYILVSCTTDVDINKYVKTHKSQIVVNASIKINGPADVILKKSLGLNQNMDYPSITDAVVKLSDSKGNMETLTEVTPGRYISKSMHGISGRIYTINIAYNNQTITSSAILPSEVKISEFTPSITKASNSEYSFSYGIKFSDPKSEKNYYRILEYLNGKLTFKGQFLTDDEIANENDQSIFNFITITDGEDVYWKVTDYINSLKKDDTISIILQSIDKSVYYYFGSFSNSFESSSPANPITNLKGNNALGYFNPYSSDSVGIIVK